MENLWWHQALKGHLTWVVGGIPLLRFRPILSRNPKMFNPSNPPFLHHINDIPTPESPKSQPKPVEVAVNFPHALTGAVRPCSR